MFGQETTTPVPGPGLREMSSMQGAEWMRVLNHFETKTRWQVLNYKRTAIVVAALDEWMRNNQISSTLWTNEDADHISETLDLYNRMDRAILGAETRKYYVTFSEDVSIVAPPSLPADQFQNDVVKVSSVSNLGYPLVTGSGQQILPTIWTVFDLFEARARVAAMKLQARAQAADVAMMANANTREKWIELKQIRKEELDASKDPDNPKISLWDKIKGGLKTAGTIAGVIAVIGLIAFAARTVGPSLRSLRTSKIER